MHIHWQVTRQECTFPVGIHGDLVTMGVGIQENVGSPCQTFGMESIVRFNSNRLRNSGALLVKTQLPASTRELR